MRAVILSALVAGLFVVCCGCVGGQKPKPATETDKTAPVVPEGMALLRSEGGGFYLIVPKECKQDTSDGETKLSDSAVTVRAPVFVQEGKFFNPVAGVTVDVSKLTDEVKNELLSMRSNLAAWIYAIELDGIEGFEYNAPHAAGEDFSRWIAVCKDGYLYTINTWRADASGEYDEVIDKIVKSFKIYAAPKTPANKGK